MLAVEVEFLTGRYVATAYNTRRDAEWPPHPARLFSALVATHFAADPPEPGEREVLTWLEGLEPPAIRASDASRRELTTVFVPVNDATVVGGFERYDDALRDARAAHGAAHAAGDAKAIKKAAAAVANATNKLDAAMARAVAPSDKASVGVVKAALTVLLEHRVRQPRTFPSVTPEVPRVTFIWPDAEAGPERAASLERLLSRVTRLGHSSSLVSLRRVAAPAAPRWWPREGGERALRVAQAGQLAALERAWELHRETEPRVMPARFVHYSETSQAEVDRAHRGVFADDWLVLRQVGGPGVPMVASVGVAQSLRRALMSFADEPRAEILSGHRDAGGPSQRDHLAVVPLAFVGRAHASGLIMGVALVLPAGVTEDERRVVYRAVANWEDQARQDDEDAPPLPIQLGPLGAMRVERVELGAVPSTLRPTTWCRPSLSWVTATPVALDRNPGDLASRDPEKLSRAVAEASETVRRACARIGLPEPIEVQILPAAPLAGAAKARRYRAFPEEAGKLRRVLTHVRLRFAEPVRGPVLIGAGRYHGLGLFRPEADDA
ncbi:MAG: type I-U CRISPR-associated protein Cas5/Cas6 [Deltaproteobacteria bacterium HGW-Deltaproteobacteria-14]|jgi:CRISPR-associated protein Csb2|nr:MAG: type I-U CRISPR-associated protein Cas5/Cas6 [Deltaproteobacteria bacterium HGW-Deltaproteobacteria-14]